MTMLEIRKLSTQELAKNAVKLRKEIVELRMRIVLGESQNVRLIRNKRKELARVSTVLSEQFLKEKI